VILKSGIPEDNLDECINFTPIFRSIEIGHNKSKKREKKLTQLMTTIGLDMSFSNYYLWYLIERFGFVIEDMIEMTVFYTNENGLFT
jgi:hypothetical protein